MAVTLGLVAFPARAGERVQVSTSPGLYPAFSRSVSDYVVRCSGSSSIGVSVNAAPGVAVTVNGHHAQSGIFSVAVPLAPNRSFNITVQDGGRTDRYFARCLPSDFPTWTTIKLATPQADWYLVIPKTANPGPRYAVMFDSDGVPVWWAPAPGGWYATFLPGDRIAWTDGSGALAENLDGTGVTRIRLIGVSPDFHELQQLPNGDYLMIGDRTTGPKSLASVGGPARALLVDNVIEEISPAGKLVWSWSAADHIGLGELQPEWVAQATPNAPPLDVFHMNAVEADGNGLVVSFRHLNAVYRIDKASGAVTWKIGGSAIAQSLKVAGDPVFNVPGGTFVGQHDARIISDGTLTLHDNGSNHRAPRAVRYVIDTKHRTATLLEAIGDPQAASSACCGSARRLPGGDWVTSWGFTPYVDEINAHSYPVLRLQWAPGWYSYRADAIDPGVLSRERARMAMSARVGE
jgi:hypothetical protein